MGFDLCKHRLLQGRMAFDKQLHLGLLFERALPVIERCGAGQQRDAGGEFIGQ